ncbi:MAG: hypothetical protein AB7H88_09445 [Vicinamibacterales bacterium]
MEPTLHALLPLALVGVLAGACAAPARAQSPPDLATLADGYLAAERARQAEGAGVTAINAALASLADGVVYEHPRVGAHIVGKDQLRTGMVNFLGTVRRPQDDVRARVTGPGVVVLNLVQAFESRQGDGPWRPQRRTVVKVLEFDGPLIRRVIDYW